MSGKANKVVKWGVLGIVAAVITIISDIVLLGRPIGTLSFFKLGTECMAALKNIRIAIGTIVGVIALPFQIAGLVPVYYGLKPVCKKTALSVCIIYAHAISMGIAFHASYAYIAGVWKLFYAAEQDIVLVFKLLEKFNSYWQIIIMIMATELILGSLIFIRMILSGKTYFPKWTALFNPLFVVIAMFPALLIIPAPVGGFIAPAYLNISSMIFISFITYQISRKTRKIYTSRAALKTRLIGEQNSALLKAEKIENLLRILLLQT